MDLVYCYVLYLYGTAVGSFNSQFDFINGRQLTLFGQLAGTPGRRTAVEAQKKPAPTSGLYLPLEHLPIELL